MTSDDVHTPTQAGPDPGAQPAEGAGGPSPEPTPVIPVSEASRSNPPGTAAPDSAGGAGAASDVIGPPDRPEVAVGAAFAGGFLAALILKRLGS